jgi:hypothetical protein
MKPYSVRPFGHLLVCDDAEVEKLDGTHILIYEPLDLDRDVPGDAEVYAAGGGRVTFYSTDDEDPQCLGTARIWRDLLGLRSTLLWDGRWYDVVSSSVVYRFGRWCVRWRCSSSTRFATMLNVAHAKVRVDLVREAHGV